VISFFPSPYRAFPTLDISHPVVVVGHTQCGGAAACFEAAQGAAGSLPVPSASAEAPINRWLAPLKSLASSLDHIVGGSAAEVLPVLVEENVKVQVKNLCQSDTILSAWSTANGKRSKPLWVHGWVYEIEKGVLKDLKISQGPSAEDL
jgi:carbonic anhydrase